MLLYNARRYKVNRNLYQLVFIDISLRFGINPVYYLLPGYLSS
jgi:hypothetical protein